MRSTATAWIRRLRLQQHPEGGFYSEVYRSGRRFGGRNCATHIYYLLRGTDCSHLHRIRSDELWHFYAGHALTVVAISPKGGVSRLRLGPGSRRGESPWGVVPAGHWFGAHLTAPAPDAFALVGCTVSPGFDFRDLELGDRTRLLRKYPRCATVIRRLTAG